MIGTFLVVLDFPVVLVPFVDQLPGFGAYILSAEDLQRQILLNAGRYVRPGGTLLYSTCTFHSAENEDQVRWMCRDLPQLIPGLKMVPDDLRPYLPEELADEETAADGYLQLLPGVHQCDGFFFARLRRSE